MLYATLRNKVEIPMIGFGVWKVDNETEAPAAVVEAIKTGYRHIDTAAIYKNEEGVAKGIHLSGVDCSELFITSKIWNDDIREGKTKEAFEGSLKRLQTDYLDLCLLHWPVDGFVDAWKDLIDLYEAGKIKAIGVSNFKEHHLETLKEAGLMAPLINQVELHPQLPQPDLLDYCQDEGIQIEAWSPLMQGKFLDIPAFSEIAEKHGKTPAQIVLRWHLESGHVALPKSVTPHRIRENFDVFDFSLDADDLAKIDQVATGERLGPDPDEIDF